MKNLFFLCSIKSHYNHVALLFFRVVVSGALMTHGYGKMVRLLEGNIWGRTHLFFNEEISMALVAFAEFICPLFVALGLGTRLFTIPIIYTFIIIVFETYICSFIGTFKVAVVVASEWLLQWRMSGYCGN